MKRVMILGVTGSIGSSTLRFIRSRRESFKIITMTANSNWEKLAEYAIEFGVENVVVCKREYHDLLKKRLLNHGIKVYSGKTDLQKLCLEPYDVSVVAISGIAALEPTMNVLQNSKIIALANKESIVCAGEFIIKQAHKYSTKIIPVDSEHNAIFQIFNKDNDSQSLRELIITASGGALIDKSELSDVKISEVLLHPNWSMGAKITVDSATMMNKGLEIIETCVLFDVPIEKVKALIHRKSLIHAIASYKDGSYFLYAAYHDMKIPISFAMNYPDRAELNDNILNFSAIGSLEFEEISEKKFPLYFIARQAFSDISSRIILSVANEIAVSEYLNGRLSFLGIKDFVIKALSKLQTYKINSADDVLKYSNYIKREITH